MQFFCSSVYRWYANTDHLKVIIIMVSVVPTLLTPPPPTFLLVLSCQSVNGTAHQHPVNRRINFLKMQLLTGAENFGNVIFRYSELTSQYHFDASIDVNRM
jgi:hypothetical protein